MPDEDAVRCCMAGSAKRSSRIPAGHATDFAHLQDDRLILNYLEREECSCSEVRTELSSSTGSTLHLVGWLWIAQPLNRIVSSVSSFGIPVDRLKLHLLETPTMGFG